MKFSASLHKSTQHTFDMYVIHTRLTKVAKLASLVITVFTELGKSRSVTSLTHGECQNSACPVVTNKRVSRMTPTAHSEEVG